MCLIIIPIYRTINRTFDKANVLIFHIRSHIRNKKNWRLKLYENKFSRN